jgi:hypothetical protein
VPPQRLHDFAEPLTRQHEPATMQLAIASHPWRVPNRGFSASRTHALERPLVTNPSRASAIERHIDPRPTPRPKQHSALAKIRSHHHMTERIIFHDHGR